MAKYDDYNTPDNASMGVDSESVSTSQEAVPVPWVAGEGKIAAHWISQARVTRIEEAPDASKKAGADKPNKYYGTAVGVVCIGPVDDLLAVVVNGAEVWPKAKAWAAAESIAVDALRAKSGRTWKALVAHTSSDLNKPPDETYWAEYSFNRDSEYYPDAPVWLRYAVYEPGDTVNWVGKTYRCKVRTFAVTFAIIYPNDDYYWEEVTVPGPSQHPNLALEGFGRMRIHWARNEEEPDADLNLDLAGTALHPAYSGLCYVVLLDFMFGEGLANLPNLELYVRRKPRQDVVGGYGETLQSGQANAAAVAAEVLTSDLLLGLARENLSLDAFNSTADRLHDRRSTLAVSALIDSQQTALEVFQLISEHSDAWIRQDAASGILEPGFFTHGEVPASYVSLTTDDLTEKPEFDCEGWDAARTAAVIRFRDRARLFKETSERYSDLRAHRAIGEPRNLELSRPWIVRRGQALKHAAEALRFMGRPQLSARLSVRREKARTIRPGDWVHVDIDLEPGGANLYQFFRVISREIPRVGPISLTLDADETLTPMPYAPEPSTPTVLDSTPAAFVNYRIVPAPHDLTERQGDILILAERPEATVTRAVAWMSDMEDGDYVEVGEINGFCARGTLATDILDSDTILPVAFDEQVDMGLLSVELGELRALHDEMLCFLVLTTAGGALDNRPSGWPYYEVCSLKQVELTGTNSYNLLVKRARLHSRPFDFDSDLTEVWIGKRSALKPIWHGYLKSLQAD